MIDHTPPPDAKYPAQISDAPVTSNCLSMVVALFTRSRKMASLSPDRRRQIGAMLHQAMSISQIATLTVKALETSVAFQGAER